MSRNLEALILAGPIDQRVSRIVDAALDDVAEDDIVIPIDHDIAAFAHEVAERVRKYGYTVRSHGPAHPREPLLEVAAGKLL